VVSLSRQNLPLRHSNSQRICIFKVTFSCSFGKRKDNPLTLCYP
jgi:hypothetical protein